MDKIIIIGAGGHAAEIDDYIAYGRKMDKDFPWKIAGFIDDAPETYKRYSFSAPYLGGIKDHKVQKDVRYLMGIANLNYRRPIIERFENEGAFFGTFIHPTAIISPSAKIGVGVVIALHVNIGPNVSIGNHTIVNSRCSIGHDSFVGHFNFLTPNVCFSGFTKVGDENMFGINSATIPGIEIGSRNKIMAGMTLDKNVGDDETVFYRFKEKIIAVSK